MPLIKKLRSNQYLDFVFTATITFKIHNAPGGEFYDYYRFSPKAFKEVFFEEMDNAEVRSIMLPPRIIGIGMKLRIFPHTTSMSQCPQKSNPVRYSSKITP